MNKPVQARSLAMIERVLDATESLLIRRGIGSLTMDAIAAEAGVSKGAVLHHFRSKDALVEALVLRKLSALKADLASHRTGMEDDDALTLVGMARQGIRQYASQEGFPRALLVAAVDSPTALETLKAKFAETLRDVETESRSHDVDLVLLFAVMGLLLTKSLGIMDRSAEEAGDLFETIISMFRRGRV